MNPLQLAIGVTLLVLAVGALAFYLISRLRGAQTVQVTLLEKKRCEYSQVTIGRHGLFGRSDWMILVCAEGKTTGFFCTEEFCRLLSQGEEGVLVFRGNHALEFHPLAETDRG